MQAKLETISPEAAREYLQANKSNRPLRRYLVEQYRKDMVNNNWELNGESIKFDAKNNLMDGQHRLEAVARHDKPVQMLVVRGLKPETFHTIDRGTQRTIGDVLHINGEANRYALAAALRLMYYYDKYAGDILAGYNLKDQVTIGDAEKTLKKHPELRDAINSISVIVAHKILVPSVAGALYHLFSQVNKNKAHEFFQKLTYGHDLPPQSPILFLRNRIIDMRNHKLYGSSRVHLIFTIKAWNAFITKTELRELTWDRTKEKFPTILGK